MTFQNKTMLITYSDSLGSNLKELKTNIDQYFGQAIGGVHLLPFFPLQAIEVLLRLTTVK